MIRLPVVILVVVGWTLLVLGVLLFTPTLMSASPCASLAQPLPGCETLDAVGNRFVWEAQQRPIVVLSIGGYVAIAVVAIAARRGRR
jgi:hypothetical protein